MRYLKTLLFTMVFAAAHTVMAAGVSYETGIIKSVDVSSNTFTVEFGDSGLTKTYSFPDLVNFIDNGELLHDKTLIEPGQVVKLKFIDTAMMPKPESTLKGIVVQFDSETGKGTLRQELTNKLIPFRLTKDLLENRADLPKTGAVVEFTYTLNEGSVASLD